MIINCFGVLMTNNDNEKYEELIELRNQIEAQIEEIKNNADEKSLEKMEKFWYNLNNK